MKTAYRTHPNYHFIKHQIRVAIKKEKGSPAFRTKCLSILGYMRGMKEDELEQLYGVSGHSIRRWFRKALECGNIDILKDNRKGHSGKKRRLSKMQLNEICLILHSDSTEYGYEVWNGKTISEIIWKKYQITLGERACQKLARSLGLSFIKPQPFPYRKKNNYDRMKYKKLFTGLLNDPHIVLVSEDEAHVYQKTKVKRGWYPKGSTPIVGSAPGNSSVALFGFVIIGRERGESVVLQTDTFNYETTIWALREFIKTIQIEPGQMFAIIMDNASWHKKARRLIQDEETYLDLKEKIIFVDIPPYSPDLNPIEQLWRKMRYELTDNRYFATIAILKDALHHYFRRLQWEQNRKEVASLCSFNFDSANTKRKPKQRIPVGDKYIILSSETALAIPSTVAF